MTGVAAEAFARYAAGCPYRIALEVERRPGNALNVEIGTPVARCRSKPPRHWPAGAGWLRWLASGGSPLVFGPCSRSCPLKPDHCEECGHRAESHWGGRGCCVPDCECTRVGGAHG